jgi:hypothetical protein
MRPHPWFNPAWRRAGAVGLCAVWTLVELVNGQMLWALIVGGLTAFAIWDFFLRGAYPVAEEPKP